MHTTPTIHFREAVREDIPLILDFVKRLAIYEHLEDQVTATPALYEQWIFNQKVAQVRFAVADGKEVGFILYFHNYSTWLGKGGIYLEDLFVLPEYRGRGIGKALLTHLASIAVEEGCGRMEWSCLDWNEPSIRFYRSLGAVPMEEWTVYRLTGDALQKLGSQQ
ncbi:MAG: GNAT family N-acetyltransferase [Sphaerochaeta sp.]|jgi:GNAT superfamily N-acetyltransferase|nr:GNAT family N-acetyltransferase [Sphaerochaeta sp.]MCH3919959.1 GNAT family N-acetyltransferase [Sphaerochaeta sp.]MCI2045574.1 GNAT family N-acetyltransferase [Sphaerochaeta sp.]MCI2076862.1 GNAT family N-acetyltransferase [Sphaerochaeta sp.]MCI2097617.1 GNAT family N-acetyltransferase [Sphaerochaeta sp.]